MAKWRLGLDVGTASVGAVAVSLADDGKERAIVWHAVRIFEEPNEKGQTGLTPKKAARREARQQRRQIDRRARRIRRVAHLATLLGLDSDSSQSDGAQGHNLPNLRAKAARERVELSELLAIFCRMAKRRGYAGSFTTAATEEEAGVVQAGSIDLKEQMAALAKKQNVASITLGEFLAARIESGLPARLKLDRGDVPNLFALRSMLEAEFSTIWTTQSEYHEILSGKHNGRSLRDLFYEAIFFQRPLKSPAPMVGKCSLEPSLPRAPRAQIAAQRFRINKTIADLRWGAGRLAEPLSSAQREEIRLLLNNPSMLTKAGEISFKKIYKALEDAGCPRPPSRSLNLDRSSREYLLGNTTLKAWENLGLLADWLALGVIDQISVINFLADLGSPEQLGDDDWHQKILTSTQKSRGKQRFREFRPAVIAFVDKLRLTEGYARFTTMGFDSGRSSYSVKALTKLADWLEHPSWEALPAADAAADEYAAIAACYPRAQGAAGKRHLSPPPFTGNDTVDVALRQIHYVVKQAVQAIRSYPTEVIIEFGRDVGAGPKKRNEWERLSAANQKLRRDARDEIEKHGYNATNSSIFRYSLWQEQSTHCPYCANPLSIEQAMDGRLSHIEHILPKSLTRVGRKRSELVIAHADCNSEKGNRTPWQAWGHDEERWAVIEQRAKTLAETGDRQSKFSRLRKSRLLTLKDFENEVMSDSSIAEFADRQLHQTSWVARSAAQWLSSMTPNVFAARGAFTAQLRKAWNLDTVIPEIRYEEGYVVLDAHGVEVTKQEFAELVPALHGHGSTPRILEKRLDHRHHVIDALVIALTGRSLYQRLARSYKKSLEQRGKDYGRWSVEPPIKSVRDDALNIVRNCNLTHKTDRHIGGRFFEDSAYSKERRPDGDRAKLVKRVTLASLAEAGTPAVVRKKLQSIESDDVRELVLQAYDRRIAAGKSAKQALAEPVAYPLYGTEIRRVRVITADYADQAEEIRFRSRQGIHTKLLKNDGYAYLDVFLKDGKFAAAELVPRYKAADFTERYVNGKDQRRFFRNDTVLDSKDGKRFVVKQFKAERGGMLILLPTTETRQVKGLSAKDGLRKVSGKGLERLAIVGEPGIAAGRVGTADP